MTTGLTAAPPRGMRDFLPQETAVRDWATASILRTYEQFGFTRIETPVLENIGLLRHGEGGENLQLIFEVLKRGEKLDKELAGGEIRREELADLGLRFDLTVPLVRFYGHNQSNLPNPLKAIQIGSVFRAESPQAGRFRQFTQCDIDIFGLKSEICEMELLQATSQALIGLGFQGFTIRINDRRILSSLASHLGFDPSRADNMFIALDKLDKIGVAGVESELRRNGHSEDAISALGRVIQSLPQGGGGFDETRVALPSDLDCEDAFPRLKNVIKAISEIAQSNYRIVFDPTLVRGMGYYTGQIFEIVNPGYSHSIAGGGRYDKMVGKFSGRDVPACGFSIGFERIIAILADKGFQPPAGQAKIAVIYDAERDDYTRVLNLAEGVRSRGSIVSMQPRKKDMRKQLDALAAQGFTAYAVVKSETDELEVKELKHSP